MRLRKTLLALTCLLAELLPVRADIPILAYYSIPFSEATPERFKEFAEAGFDVGISFFFDGQTTADMLRALDNAQKAGTKLMAAYDGLYDNQQQSVQAIKNHPALFGYYVSDEPQARDLPKIKNIVQAILRHDSSKPVYVNLPPYHSDEAIKAFGMGNRKEHYEQYVETAAALGTQQLSFDFYPIRDAGIMDNWYNNLEIIRQASLKSHLPFWGFALCTPHIDYPQPTLPMLRLQIYSNLAYGAQGIEYFTYWTPAPDSNYDFHNGPISTAGKRTKTYTLVKTMNKELRQLLPLFDGATVLSVSHMIDIPRGTRQLKTAPTNIKKMAVKGEKGAIVSTMQKGGHRYMVVVNKDYKTPLTLTITAKSEKVVQVSKTLARVPLKPSYEVGGGDMLIFQLN